jgi:hypothetical protein
VTYEDLLSNGSLSMKDYDTLIEAMRGANAAVEEMRSITDWLAAERRHRGMEAQLGIPVSPVLHAYLAARHEALAAALV